MAPQHPPQAVRDGRAWVWKREYCAPPLADPPRTLLLFIIKGEHVVHVHEALPVPDIDAPPDERWAGTALRLHDKKWPPLLRPSYEARTWLGKSWNDPVGRALREHLAASAAALWRSYRPQ